MSIPKFEFQRTVQATWFRRVFGVVEKEHFRAGRLGGDQTGVLRHVARSVHLALVVYLDLHLDLPRDVPKTAEFYKQRIE